MKKFSKVSKVFQGRSSNGREESHVGNSQENEKINDVNLQDQQMESNYQDNLQGDVQSDVQSDESGDINQSELNSELKSEINSESAKNLMQKLQQEQSAKEKLLKENESLQSIIQEQNNFFSKREKETAAALNEVEKWKSYAAQIKSEMDSIIVRNEKSIADTKEYAVTKFAKDILVVVDSFEKAIESMQVSAQVSSQEGAQEDVQESVQGQAANANIGVSIIMKELLGVLKSHGISQVESDGVEFDPALHMAVSQEKDDNMPVNYVIKTLRKGYKIGDRCLREALVVVNLS